LYFSLIDANKEETSFVTVGGTTLNSYAEVGDSMSGLKKKGSQGVEETYTIWWLFQRME
jgi:hypothetical protein